MSRRTSFPNTSDHAFPNTSEHLCVVLEELFQRLRVLSGQGSDRIADPEATLAFADSGGSEKPPKMAEVIESMRVEAAGDGLGPLLVRYFDVANWTLEHPAEGVHNFIHRRGFSDQIVGVLAALGCPGQQSSCHASDVLRTNQRYHRVS